MNEIGLKHLKIKLPDYDIDHLNFCFIDFVKLLPLQGDEEISSFMIYAKGVPNFKITSDPIKLSEYLYKKLDLTQTVGFIKTYLMFATIAKKNDIPKPYKSDQAALLKAVNHIRVLQHDRLK